MGGGFLRRRRLPVNGDRWTGASLAAAMLAALLALLFTAGVAQAQSCSPAATNTFGCSTFTDDITFNAPVYGHAADRYVSDAHHRHAEWNDSV